MATDIHTEVVTDRVVQRKNVLARLVPAALLSLLIACGAYLRLHGLGNPSLWVDEVNHVLAGRDLSEGRAPAFPSGEPNNRALLYSHLVGLSFRYLGEGEWQARLPSAIFGILTIPLVYALGAAFGGRRLGLLSAFLVTFSHFEIGWSRLCRMYSMFQFFFLLASLLGLRLLWRIKRLDDRCIGGLQAVVFLFLSVASAIIAFAVHILTVEIFAIFFAYVFLLVLARSIEHRRWSAERWENLVFAGALALVGLSLLLPPTRDFLKWIFQYRPSWTTWSMATDSHYYYWFLTESKKWPLLAFFSVGVLAAIAKDDRKAWFWIVAFLLPVIAQTFFFSYRLKNYIFHVYPFFLIGAATGFLSLVDWLTREMNLRPLWRRVPRTGQTLVAYVMVLGWLPLTVWFRYGVKVSNIGEAGDNGAVNHLDWKGATRFVATRWAPADILISTLPLTVQYYLGRCDYNLNLANAREDLDWSNPDKAGLVDFYSGATNIPDIAALKQVLNGTSGNAWLLVDRYRFSKAGYVPRDVASYVQTRCELVWNSPSGTVDVYRCSGANTKCD